MKLLIIRSSFITLLIGYMIIIWLQTSYFNPESVSTLSSKISMAVIMLIGTSLEVAHFFEFSILYLLVIIVFLSFGELSKWKEYIAITFSILYGFIDEIHQMYIPFRSASIVDLFKNTIGILFMWWIIRRYYYKNQNSRLGKFIRKITMCSIDGN